MDNTIPLFILNFDLILDFYQSLLGSRALGTPWGLRPAASEETWVGEGLVPGST